MRNFTRRDKINIIDPCGETGTFQQLETNAWLKSAECTNGWKEFLEFPFINVAGPLHH